MNMAANTLIQKLKNVGPGALVAAGFIGPGTVTTCTVSGASYGYTLLWALLFATIATILFQEMAARIGIITQQGLGENIRQRITQPALRMLAIVVVILAIFVGNIAYETGNVTGSVMGLQAFVDIPSMPAIIVIALLGFVFLWIGSYKLVEGILTAIVVFMGVVFFVTALASPVNWGEVVHGMFVPALPDSSLTKGVSPVLIAAGLVGTTVVPYNLFLHASGASERFKDPSQVADARFDAVLSIGLGGVISMAILVCAAANIHGSGIAVTNGKDMAAALSPLLGSWATCMVGLGLLAAGFSSVITASLSAAYAVNGVLGWNVKLKDVKFKLIWLIVLASGCIMAVMLGKSPTQLILTAQAANALLLPVMAFFVLVCANAADLGSFKNHVFSNIAGVVIILITLFIAYKNLSAFVASVMKLIS